MYLRYTLYSLISRINVPRKTRGQERKDLGLIFLDFRL